MAKTYETIPEIENAEAENRGLISKEAFLYKNHFANYSVEELKELFNQYRFFCNNGYFPKDCLLEKIRERICKETPLGIKLLQDELMFAIVAKFFMDEDK